MSTAATLRHKIYTTATLLVVSVAVSATLVTATESAAVAADSTAGRMVLVLDSSGSMQEPAEGGQTKIAAAKDALDQVIGALPDDQSVGLRVFGAKVFARSDPGACSDSQLVVPVGTDNRAELSTAVDAYEPFGETPIGYALEQAGEDLGSEGKRTIVLVSDGESTCSPDPCKTAADLAAQGVELRIDVVGLDVDGSARRQLQCIAGAGRGTYYDVDSAEEFAVSLDKLTKRAARPYSAIGEPVSGTPTFIKAPTITAGDWLDELGTTERELTNNYLIRREIPGSTLHFSASVRTVDSFESLNLTLATPDGVDCGSSSGYGSVLSGALLSAGASADGYDYFGDRMDDQSCVKSDLLIATFEDTVDQVSGPRPLEIRVIEEPPVASIADLPERVDEFTDFDLPYTAPVKTTGGSSFADAPLLEPGVYSDTIVSGELLVYQVDVGWGQQLGAQVDFPAPLTKLGEAVGIVDVRARVDAFGPSRVQGSASTGGLGQETYLSSSDSHIAVFASPVRYRNREESGVTTAAALAGRYTVTVFVEEDPDRESYSLPFTLRIGVDGDEDGAPEYLDVGESVDPTTDSTTEGTTAPPSQTTAAPPSESTETESTDSIDTVAGEGDGDGGAPPLALGVAGLGLLALVGAGFLVLRHQSR